jgi:hypothetical protein
MQSDDECSWSQVCIPSFLEVLRWGPCAGVIVFSGYETLPFLVSFDWTRPADRLPCGMKTKDNLKSTLILVWNLWWLRFVRHHSSTSYKSILLFDVLRKYCPLNRINGQWQEIQKKWDTRLSALFVSIDLKGDGNINYDSFQEVRHYFHAIYLRVIGLTASILFDNCIVMWHLHINAKMISPTFLLNSISFVF